MNISEMTIKKLSEKIKKRELSVSEVTKLYLNNIKKSDIGAYITVASDYAEKRAEEMDKKLSKGDETGTLFGIPFAVKDNIVTKDILTTCASKMLENFVPEYNATVIDKLANRGSVMLGKTNMDEFAMGSTTESSYFKTTKNPVNKNYVPGGSSGGSAAAVSNNEAAFALGSDTGGSVRQPAAFCNVVGLKPSYGIVSRYGLIAFASSLDQISPVTKNVYDSAIVLNEIAGFDSMDSTTVKKERTDYTLDIKKGVRGMKTVLPKEYFDSEIIDKEIKAKVLEAAECYEKMGAKVEYVSMPSLKYAVYAYYIISSAEASSNLARYDGLKYGYCTKNYKDTEEMYKKTRSEGFGEEVKRRIMLGTFVLSAEHYNAYYKKAVETARLVKNEFNKMFEKYDFILTPVTPRPPYEIGKNKGTTVDLYNDDIYTAPVNIAGLPALSVPCGFNSKGLPIGVQLIGNRFDEKTILRAGYAYEEEVNLNG